MPPIDSTSLHSACCRKLSVHRLSHRAQFRTALSRNTPTIGFSCSLFSLIVASSSASELRYASSGIAFLSYTRSSWWLLTQFIFGCFVNHCNITYIFVPTSMLVKVGFIVVHLWLCIGVCVVVCVYPCSGMLCTVCVFVIIYCGSFYGGEMYFVERITMRDLL